MENGSQIDFKLRYANHTKSFNTEKYKNDTELSKEIWKIKEANLTPTIKWKIVKQCKSYNPATRSCMLCLYEKYEIIMYKHGNLLNKKNKMVSKCRHKNKFLLSKFDTTKNYFLLSYDVRAHTTVIL